MPETFPAIEPDRNSKLVEEDRILRADFNDNYSQTAPDGINNTVIKWQLSFMNYPGAMIDQIVTFLKARKSSEAFYWTPPFEVTPTLWKQVGAREVTYPGGTAKSLTVMFQQVPL